MAFDAVIGVMFVGMAIVVAAHAWISRRRRVRDEGERARDRALATAERVVAWLRRYHTFGRVANALGMRASLAAAGVRAGLPERFDADLLLLLCAAFAAAGAIWGALVIGSGAGICVCACAGASMVPLLLSARARRRQEAIERALPFVLDGIVLAVEAGLDFNAALARVVAGAQPGPLRDELGIAQRDLRMGATRREALTALARRVPMPAMASVVALVTQADRLGARLGPVLRVAADRQREARLARAERRGAAASTMALIPLVFCIMPATFIVVFGPLVVRFVTGGIEAFF